MCIRCSAKFRTCCRADPKNTINCFPLSPAELHWLRSLHPDKAFAVQEPNSRSFIRHMRHLFPTTREIGRVFPPGAKHPRLKTTKDGSCVFLDSWGCLLPYEKRPLFCCIYPFWVNREKITAFDDPGCLAIQENQSIKDLLVLFDQTPREIYHLYHLMLKNLNCT